MSLSYTGRSILRLSSNSSDSSVNEGYPYEVEDSQIVVLSTLSGPSVIALPRVNVDGSTEAAAVTGTVAVWNEGRGTIEVLDANGRRVDVVTPWETQCFHALSSGPDTADTSLEMGYPGWIPIGFAESPASAHATTTFRQPLIFGASVTVSSIDIDGATNLISGNTISTLLNPAGAAGDSISCASTLGAAFWAVQSSHAEIQIDTALRGFIEKATSLMNVPLIELETAINKCWVGLAAAGLMPAIGPNTTWPDAGGSISILSCASELEGDWPDTSAGTGFFGPAGTSFYAGKFGKYILSSAYQHVGASLNFDIALVLPAVGETSMSTFAHSTGCFVTIENRADNNTIEVQDSYGHRLRIMPPHSGAVFQSVTSHLSTDDNQDGVDQWALSKCRLQPGREGLAADLTSALNSALPWGPLDLSTVCPQVSCLNAAGLITSLSTATLSSATDSTAIVAAGEYCIGQLSSMAGAAWAAINNGMDALMEVGGAYDFSTYTS